MAYLTTNTASQFSVLQFAQRAFAGLSLRIQKQRLYRRTFDELSALTNRELADLGLDRSEIQRVAIEAARDAKL